jgi:hypothetical protein
MSNVARSYLNQALDIMQQNSLHKKEIDWAKLRAETLAQAKGAQTTYDTYDAIWFALGHLGDHHSFLQLSTKELQEKYKETQMKKPPSLLRTAGSEPWPPSPYINRQISAEIEPINGIRVAHIVVPAFEGSDDEKMHLYANTLQDDIKKLANSHPVGWIVDLRGNLGGNMWPMLAGVGPLAGTGTLGTYLGADGKEGDWFYHSNGAGIRNSEGKENILIWIQNQSVKFQEPPPVAVLIDRGTASSGEAIAISFRGRPNTRFFGRHTHGESTSNNGFSLPDGANLVLTTAIEEDRTGKAYPDGVSPDVELPEDKQLPASENSDAAICAAVDWFKYAAGNH